MLRAQQQHQRVVKLHSNHGFGSSNVNQSTDESNKDCMPVRNNRASRGDRDESSKNTVESHGDIPLSGHGYCTSIPVRQAAEGESVVVTATFEATCPSNARVEPQLNPYHPNQRMSTPIATSA
mmetsp:Transcript_5673/g.7557  ORF Transcript_5673/g.7557 Transcript_5673/m.7557 type:complete len:123 (+) Transcript_5673:216-584(+)